MQNYWYTPNGDVETEPGEAIFGPKVMLINPYAGSGRRPHSVVFPPRGGWNADRERTWGGEVGITGYPPLIDGGLVTAPSISFFTTEGKWGIENEGVPPDIETGMDPKAWREGHDPQLEQGVKTVLETVEAAPAAQPDGPGRFPFTPHTELVACLR